jgi:predicted amidohydrolase YtcJ
MSNSVSQPYPNSGLAPALAIVNARVWTGDTRRPWADALLVRGESIALVGASAEVKKSAGSSTLIIDAKGMMVTAAFIDDNGQGIEELAGRTLRAGQRADFVVLDRDITRASPEEIRNARVMFTMLAGRVAYDPLNLAPPSTS